MLLSSLVVYTKLSYSQLTCLSAAIANSTCSPTDVACTCTNEALTAQATVCIMGSCTMPEILCTSYRSMRLPLPASSATRPY